MSRRERTECIYPISPLDQGRIFILRNGYQGVVVTDSTIEAAVHSTVDFFERRTDEELAELKVHRSLVRRPDFISGVIKMTRFQASWDAETKLYEDYDRGIYPHLEELELERQFEL
ncbi:hypothetical protein HYS42_01430 [Candidatus Saccharibacteria bacterium]|nr:hypothetical protein [Candidatus Saccharibacteria bacterium]